jgi:predicted RecA/RadA family phage recombinase
MRNFVQEDEIITLAALAAVKSGDVVIVGSILGIAATDAAMGDDVECITEGVFELPKAGVAMNQGAKAFWDTAGKVVVGAAGSGICPLGAVTESAGSSAATVRVRLDGVATAVA